MEILKFIKKILSARKPKAEIKIKKAPFQKVTGYQKPKM
jgi:hypothetical protein